MRLELNYGRRKVDLEIPDENINAIRRPPQRNSLQSDADMLWSAVQKFGVLNLSSFIYGKRVGVLVDTNMSFLLQQEILTLLFPFLDAAASISFFLNAGFEEPDPHLHLRVTEYIRHLAMCYPNPDRTAAEGRSMPRLTICSIDEKSSHVDAFLEVGATRRGTPICIDRRVHGCDVLLIVAGIQHHSYAGYHTALDTLVPGVCHPRTAAALQMLAMGGGVTFGTHPLYPDPARRHQPVAADLWDAAQQIIAGRPIISISTIAHDDRLLWVAFGELQAVCAEGMAKCDEILSFNINAGDYLIVSPGRPQGKETFYSACRAFEMTRHAVHPQGETLFLAACNDGIGPYETMPYFYDLLVQPLSAMMEKVRTDYQLHCCVAYRLADIFQKQRAVFVKAELPDDALRRMHLRPCGSPQALVEGWLAKKPDAKINIFDGALLIGIFSKIAADFTGTLPNLSVPPVRRWG